MLGSPISVGEHAVRAKRARRLPEVMTRSEGSAVPTVMTGVPRLEARLLYGSRPRIEGCLSLRVKDIGFAERTILVRAGKGNKDGRTVLPDNAANDLQLHLALVRRLHERDLAAVALPDDLLRKFPAAPTEWSWQSICGSGRCVPAFYLIAR